MRDFAPLRARTLRVINAVDAVGPLSLPAGTPVVVVGFESLGAPFGQWLFEHAGRVFKAPHDALDVQLPGGQALSVGELVDELLLAHSPEPPPPTVRDVLDLLEDMEQVCAGRLDREEFMTRKRALLDRIRRHRGSDPG